LPASLFDRILIEGGSVCPDSDNAKELKQLRGENQRLKRMVADRELQTEMLREVATGKW
jgi:hypothetical protein